MGFMLKSLAVAVVFIAVGIGYLIYHTPVPSGMQHRDIARLTIVTGKIAVVLAKVTTNFGISRLEFGRWLMKINARIRGRNDHLKSAFQTLEMNGVNVRVFRAKDKKKKVPAVVYFPGGGWMMQELDLYQKSMMNLTQTTRCTIILVDYRIAPENKFPAAVEDAEKVVIYLIENGEKLWIDNRRIAVIGDSSGGNLAAAVGLSLRKLIKFVMILNAPLQGLDLNLPSYQQYDNLISSKEGTAYTTLTYLLGMEPTEEMMHRAMTNKLYSSSVWQQHGHKISTNLLPARILEDNNFTTMKVIEDYSGYSNELNELVADHRFAPLMADDLSGLPETFILSCEYDVFRDDSFLYAARLREAGVVVTHKHEACFHGAIVIVRDHPIWMEIAQVLLAKLGQ